MRKSSEQLYKELVQMHNETTCTCTPEQETGEDSSLCRNCNLAGELNKIGELITDVARDFGLFLSF